MALLSDVTSSLVTTEWGGFTPAGVDTNPYDSYQVQNLAPEFSTLEILKFSSHNYPNQYSDYY